MTFTERLYSHMNRTLFAGLFVFCMALTAPATTLSPTATPNPSPQPAATPDGSNGSASGGATTTAAAPGRGRVVPAEKMQPVRITKFDKAPVIDGRLDDDVWKTAAVFKDFYQTSPGDNVAPSKLTETMIGYDAKTLYIAFHCFDEPDKVRATVTKRDDVLNGTEDSIRVLLDTFNDKRKAYVLAFNPFGIQMDGIRTEGVNVDFSVDIVMQSQGALTEDGYVVEVAIPFKSLRYEAGKGKQWGIQIFRIIQRFNGEQDSWMPISRDVNGILNQAGHITGLDGISAERTLELIPSITVSETGKLLPHFNFIPNDPGRMVNEPIKFDLGLTAKYTLTPTSTINLAINPDFAQVEADATVVTTNQRFPIFYQEKRPFFLEGIDMFQLPLNVVHTRTIINPLIAAKLVGKTGRNSYGLMFAADRGPGTYVGDDRLDPFNFPLIDKKAYVGVLRLKRDIGKENSIGMVATSYNFPEKHNQIAGIDARFKLDPQTTLTLHLVGTTSNRYFRDPEFDIGTCANLTGRDRVFCRRQQVYRTGNGLGYLANYTKSGRHLFVQAQAFGRTADFRSDVGFVRRTNTNEDDFFVSWNSTPQQKARLVSWNIESFNQVLYDWSGRIQGGAYGGHLFFNFQKQSFFGGGFDNRYEKDYEEEFGTSRHAPCINNPDPTKACHARFFGEQTRATNNKVWFLGGGTTPKKQISMNFFANFGYGAMDYDFGGGSKYPRISPAAILTRQIIAAGQCTSPAPGTPDTRSPLCFGPLDPGPGFAVDLNGFFSYKPTNELSLQLNYTKARLRRYDTNLVAFDDNIYTLRGTYQFTRFTFARARVDYDSLNANISGQFLLGWTPNPGTAFYVGYNDDLNHNGYNPFTGDLEQGFRRNGRTFFIKFSYLIRKSFG